MVSKDDIINALREVYDPEIPINVYDLGLIYEITVKDSGYVHILMSLTSPTCPTADYIQEMVHDAVAEVDGVNSVDVEMTFDPLWTPDRVSSEAREELGLDFDSSSDKSVANVFENDSSSSLNLDSSSFEKDRICFNCAIDDSKLPILECYYKGEKTHICSKCLGKYS